MDKGKEHLQFIATLFDKLNTKKQVDDFVAAFSKVIGIFTSMKADIAADRKSMVTQFSDLKAAIIKGNDGRDGKDGTNGTNGLDGLPGPQGEPGKDGNIKDLAPEEIRNALELLQDDERLDASAIKNLPEFPKAAARGVLTASALYSLADVDVAGITVGQSIKWDGIRWIPFTPAGANTSVFGETPTDSSDHINFTLVHTPATGTVRLYRGGAYQQAGANKDYAISGGTITLSTILQSGEILQTDYEY